MWRSELQANSLTLGKALRCSLRLDRAVVIHPRLPAVLGGPSGGLPKLLPFWDAGHKRQ
jgi:hypothetical protein